MRKRIVSILLIVMLLGVMVTLAGCGSSQKEENVSKTENETTISNEEKNENDEKVYNIKPNVSYRWTTDDNFSYEQVDFYKDGKAVSTKVIVGKNEVVTQWYGTYTTDEDFIEVEFEEEADMKNGIRKKFAGSRLRFKIESDDKIKEVIGASYSNVYEKVDTLEKILYQ